MSFISIVDVISQDILDTPVVAQDGNTYSRKSLFWWFNYCRDSNIAVTSPTTGLLMGQDVVPNKHVHDFLSSREEQIVLFRRGSPERNFEVHQPVVSIKALTNALRHINSQIADRFSWIKPTLIVLGERNSGKSALLERLTMISCFPQLNVPVHVEIRNAKSECSISAVVDICDRFTDEKIIPTTVIPCIDQASMWVMSAAEMLKADSNDEEYTLSTSRYIVVRITSPYLPSIDLIDLPGLTAKDCSGDPYGHVAEIMASHPHAFYIAALEAATDIGTSLVLKFVEKFNLKASTFGVIIKCDLVSRRRMKELKTLISSPEVTSRLPNGFVFVMNHSESLGESDGSDYLNSTFDDDCMSSLTNSEHMHASNAGSSRHLYDGAVQGLFGRERSNYGRLIRQCENELAWFKVNDCNDLLAAGVGGTPSLIAKLNSVYVAHIKEHCIPGVLFSLVERHGLLRSEYVSLGVPTIPRRMNSDFESGDMHHEQKVDAQWENCGSELKKCMVGLVEGSEREMLLRYGQEVLRPLLEGVELTSVIISDITCCLSEQNHVDTFLAELRSEIGGICRRCVERARNFWGNAVVDVLMADQSNVKLSRVGFLLDAIKENINIMTREKLSGISGDMDGGIWRVLSAANTSGGVSVRYNFTSEMKASIAWDATDLANGLVFVLSRRTRMLTANDIIEVIKCVLDESVKNRCLFESCEAHRLQLSECIAATEHSIQSLLIPYHHIPKDSTVSKTASSISSHKILLRKMKASGLDASALKRAGFTTEQLLDGGFTTADLVAANISVVSLHLNGFSIGELREAGADLSVLANHLLFEGVSFDILVKDGISFSELKAAGINLVDMMDDTSELVRIRLLTTFPLLKFSPEEGSEIIKHGDIFCVIRHLNDEDLCLQQCVLSLLRDILLFNDVDSDVVEALSVTESIPLLCGMVTHSDSRVMTNSLAILSRIARAEKALVQIIACDILTRLIRIVMCFSSECRSFAVAIIKYIANYDSCLVVDTVDTEFKAIIFTTIRDVDATSVSNNEISASLDLIRLTDRGEKYTDEHLGAISTLLLSSTNESVHLTALQLVASLFKQSHNKESLIKTGVIDALVRVLSRTQSNECMFHCLELLHTLCRSSANKPILLEADIVAVLNDIMTTALFRLVDDEKIWICSILRSLSKEGRDIKVAIVRSGFADTIIHLLAGAEVDAVKEAAANLISTLAGESSNCDLLAASGCIEPLVEMLYLAHDGCKETAASALRFLAASDSNRIAIAEAGALDPLLDMMRHNSIPCRIMAARTLRNMSFNCNDNKVAIANLGGIDVLIDMLGSGETNMQACAAGLLQNLTFKNDENQLLVVSGGALDLLGAMMQSGVELACQEACGVLRNLSVDPANCTSIVRSGVVVWIVKELNCGVKARRDVAAETLRNICHSNDIYKTTLKDLGVSAKMIKFNDEW